ncbi:hypothetical protein GCK72_013963 [Caenorhabditis remanei]|uniref:Puromycin-sensitive aminopeptidase n=1 Tax=Caenorhabditis remanei TaxID=31234 RepID=A0A6A5GQN2_CAERE|nr:hypothetical protein GCK72_013963 [Caenorhabditis remanei]KAF1757507.1 hypothetical protein GCK72_013963 [Caenorhabditis remanei]
MRPPPGCNYTVRIFQKNQFSFEGLSTVDVTIKEATDVLKVHAQSLLIQSVSLITNPGDSAKKLDTTYDDKLNILSIKLPSVLQPQKVQLVFKLIGELNDKMRGFYRSQYKDKDGSEKFLASTQFESTYARLAFPYFDEPISKATFDVTLEVDSHLTALSNMNVISETPTTDGKRKVVTFAAKRQLRTEAYIIVCRVKSEEYIINEKDRIRVIFSQQKTIDSVYYKTLSERIGVLMKKEEPQTITLIVHDNDLKISVEILDSLTLTAAIDSSKSNKKWIFSQLFEVFETILRGIGVPLDLCNLTAFQFLRKCDKDYEYRMFCDEKLSEMNPEGIDWKCPQKENGAEVLGMKSVLVLNMIMEYIGEDKFLEALSNIKWSSHNDEYQLLRIKDVDDEVKLIYSSWMGKSFPILSVKQRQDGNNRVLTVEQRIFISDGCEGPKNSLWQVPITVSVGSAPSDIKARFLLKEKQQEFVVEGVAPGEWVKLNSGSRGFYRVEYSDEMLTTMLPDIASRKMPVLDRFGLINDLSALLNTGRVSIAQFVQVATSSANEDEYVVWGAIDRGFKTLISCHENYESLQEFHGLIVKIYQPIGDKIIENNTWLSNSSLSALITNRLSEAGYDPSIIFLAQLFSGFVNQGQPICEDFRIPVWKTISQHFNEFAVRWFPNVLNTSGSLTLQNESLYAVGSKWNVTDLERIFEKVVTVNPKLFSEDNCISLMQGITENLDGKNFAWDFFQNNFERHQLCFDIVWKVLLSSLVGKDNIGKIRRFFNINMPNSASAVSQTINKIRSKGTLMMKLENYMNDSKKDKLAPVRKRSTILKVEQRSDGNNRVLTVEQQRFFSDGGEDTKNSLWQVPITVSVGSAPSDVKARFLLKEKQQEFVVEGVAPDEWVKLKTQQFQFYRVEYSEEMLTAMLPDIASRKMPVLDRFGLINDLSALLNTGRVSIAQFVQVAASSANEDEYVVWGAIDEGMSKLLACSREMSEETLKSAKQLIVKMFEKTGADLGFAEQSGEDTQKMMLRALVQARLARAGHQPTIDKFNQMFTDFLEKGTPIHPDIRLATFGVVARSTGKEGFDKLMNLRETTTFQEIERQAMIAMSQTPEQPLLAQLFEYGFEKNKVRPQDQLYLFLGTGSTHMGQQYAWQYFCEHIKEFLEKYGGANSSLFQRCLKFAGESFGSEHRAVEFQNFFCNCKDLTDTDRKTLARPIGQTVEAIRLNARLLEANRSIIENLLKQIHF